MSAITARPRPARPAGRRAVAARAAPRPHLPHLQSRTGKRAVSG